MDNYLENCKKQLKQLSSLSSPVELVVGNESCDLDSAVSAVGLAFIKHIEYNSGDYHQRLVVPILNATRNELSLKTEVIFWFENSVHLNCEDLICRDEINWELLKTKKVLITLVDHNSNDQLARIGEIIEIIDHHKYDTTKSLVSDPSKLLIDLNVGSCSTLVAEKFLKSKLRNDTQLALMFFGTIVLDTLNFSDSAQKYSERDKNVIKELESIIEDKSISRSECYKQLSNAKNSTNHLTFEQLLFKDKKMVANTRIIISSISGQLVSNMDLESKRTLFYELSSNENYRFEAIILLGIDNTNNDCIGRDLAVFTKNTSLMTKITSKLESESNGLELSLVKDLKDLRIYKQNNVKASRKQIMPLISSIYETNGTDTTNGTHNIMNKESELEIPNIDNHKVNNPESVYGSYIEDSFVGELVGDYPNNDDKDEHDLDHHWTLNNGIGINNEIEFDFDSFGPESIQPVFTDNNDINREINPNDIKVKLSLSEETLNDEVNQSNELQTKQINEQNNENSEKQMNGSQNSEAFNQSFLSVPNDVSSTSESDISQTLSEEIRDEINSTPFKRNTSLTQSQRKKISPRINIQQILNSSDDLSPGIVPDESSATHTNHPLSINVEPISANSLNTSNISDGSESKGLNRRPSTTKKKIPVNREFFKSDEFNDKSGDGEASHIEELSARQELEESRAWKESCPMGPEGDVKQIDMKVIDPYKKVISHGGYFHSNNTIGNCHQSGTSPAIIVFSSCYLPDRSRKDYNYVMDHLFMYVLTTLHNLIADDYILIYFHNAGVSSMGNNMPTFGWLKRCYYMIDRRLKKNLKGLYLVHPTFWLKTLIIMSKPFISSKFSKKLKFVSTLAELSALLPIEHIAIPEAVKTIDTQVMSRQRKSRRTTQ
ncbi:uncharacterized protein LOC128958421 isoform X1 [Oppia nitens]|uniref:uncharacterized protein LOC128958421 isoform X1 n=1 Tax=Oppia nitens TaxID=1686743 RepID=UPI0023DB5D5D|nr:uncharacterized protein LOC128958421 isoform X1 [Oppia nitens]